MWKKSKDGGMDFVVNHEPKPVKLKNNDIIQCSGMTSIVDFNYEVVVKELNTKNRKK